MYKFKSARLFISYLNEDSAHVGFLRQDLEDAGFDCYFDKTDLLAGEFDEKIKSEIKNRDCFIACLTPESISASSYVSQEWQFAIEWQKSNPEFQILPVVLEWHNVSLIEKSIFKKFSGFSISNNADLLIIRLKQIFKIPIIYTGQYSNILEMLVGTKMCRLKTTYYLWLLEVVSLIVPDNEPIRKYKINLFNFKSSIKIRHPELKSDLEVIRRFQYLDSSQLNVEVQYENVKVYPINNITIR